VKKRCPGERKYPGGTGKKYVFDPENPTTKKERKNKGRSAESLGFTGDFMPEDPIVKYLDNNRKGRLSPCCLIPYEKSEHF
jgi:hypothetical protein